MGSMQWGYTETGCDYPDYVNMSVADTGEFSVTIREAGTVKAITNIPFHELLQLRNAVDDFIVGVAAYRNLQMCFGNAVNAMKKGLKVARVHWHDYGMFAVQMEPLSLPPHSSQQPGAKVNDRTAKFIGDDTPLHSLGYFACFVGIEGNWQPGWLPSQSDILAEDWVIVP